MPLRIAKQGAMLTYFDGEKWRSKPGLSLQVLNQNVTIQPGVTLGRLFDLVAEDDDLVDFIAAFTGCDVRTLHRRDRMVNEIFCIPIEILNEIGDYEAVLDDEGNTKEVSADVIKISRDVRLTDALDSFEVEWNVKACNREHDLTSAGLGKIKHSATSRRWNCGSAISRITCEDNGRRIIAEHDSYPLRLIDLLGEIYSPFGKSPYPTYSLKTISHWQDILSESADDETVSCLMNALCERPPKPHVEKKSQQYLWPSQPEHRSQPDSRRIEKKSQKYLWPQ